MSFIHSWSTNYVHNDGDENGDVNGHTDDDIDDGDDDDDDDFDDDDDRVIMFATMMMMMMMIVIVIRITFSLCRKSSLSRYDGMASDLNV